MTTPTLADEIAALRDAIYRLEYREVFDPLNASPKKVALRSALARLEATQWRLITDEQKDGEVYLLERGEAGLDPFVGYWDGQQGDWFSLAGAYPMGPTPIYFMPLSSLPSPPEPQEGER